jgi:uncharacterized protein YegL
MFNLESKTGKNVYKIIREYFEKLKIWEKVVFLCTDGEPAMAGDNNGFAAYFLKEKKFGISLICLNHRENTGIKHLYIKIPKILNFHVQINELIVFLRSSYKIVG